MSQLSLEEFVYLEDACGVTHGDLHSYRLLNPGQDANSIDRRRGYGMDVGDARFERNARAAPGHVQRVSNLHYPGLNSEASLVPMMGADSMKDFGDYDRALSEVVDAGQQLFGLTVGQANGIEFVVVTMHRDSQIVKATGEDDDDFGILCTHSVISHNIHLPASISQHPEKFQPHVRHHLGVHRS